MNEFCIDIPRAVITPPCQLTHHSADVLVVGAGVAGLAAALAAADSGATVSLVLRDTLATSNSAWAQGGVAAALAAGDSPRFHVADTLTAGAGLCDPAPVATLTWDAPGLMRELATMGVPFERTAGDFVLGLEGGHSQRRILHVGDTTGWAITAVLIERAQRHKQITIVEGCQAVDLLGGPERCAGILARDNHGAWHSFQAGATVLATGGAGALYGLTSNQPGALGEGIALAFRAGAAVADMEFVQFHPTVLRTRDGQGFLISEAARGEGGRLLSLDGERFMPAYDPRAELAPRDVVTRGIYAALQRSGSDHVLLDLSHLPADFLARRFPTITARCKSEGIDPATTPIPVAPAAHYLMGGICTDLNGATTLPGLFAAGECTCTGVHGANRLASNSLLECLVFGRRAGQAAAATANALPQIAPVRPATGARADLPADWHSTLTSLMRTCAGPLRDGAGLRDGLRGLATLPLVAGPDQATAITVANATLAARLIVSGALLREESRGAHFRSDFPQPAAGRAQHIVIERNQAPRSVATIAELFAAVPAEVRAIA